MAVLNAALARTMGALGFLRSSQRGVRDVVTSLVPQAVRVVTGIVSAVLLTRGLGPGGLGDYALAMSVAETAGMLSDLGVGQTGARYAARAAALGDRARQMAVLRWAFRTRLGLAAAITLTLYLAAPWLVPRLWGAGRLATFVRLALPIGLFTALSSVPITYFQSERRFGRNAAVQAGQSLLTLVGVCALALAGRWSVPTALGVVLLSTGLGAAVFLFMVPREAWWRPAAGSSTASVGVGGGGAGAGGRGGTGTDIDKVGHFAFFMLLSTLVVFVTGKIDLWMIGHYLDRSQVGIYNAAGRLTLPLTMVLGAMNTVLWPRVAAATGIEATRALAVRTFKASVLVAAAGTAYAIAAPLLAPVLFGKAYGASVTVAQLLCLGQCVAILVCPIGVVGYNLGLVRLYWVLNVLQLGLVVAILFPLLPRYGAVVGAVAYLASITCGGAASGYFVWRQLRRRS